MFITEHESGHGKLVLLVVSEPQYYEFAYFIQCLIRKRQQSLIINVSTTEILTRLSVRLNPSSKATIQRPLWRLGPVHNSRRFQTQTTDTIVRTLLEERGVVTSMFDLKSIPQ